MCVPLPWAACAPLGTSLGWGTRTGPGPGGVPVLNPDFCPEWGLFWGGCSGGAGDSQGCSGGSLGLFWGPGDPPGPGSEPPPPAERGDLPHRLHAGGGAREHGRGR